MIDGFASGSWIRRRTCRSVAPNALPTSRAVDGTDRTPKLVSRIAAGSAKTTVAMSAVATPIPKKITSGSRYT